MNLVTPNVVMPKEAPVPSLSRQTMRVLVVDDDDFQLALVSDILRALGVHNVTVAADGQQALHSVRNAPQPYDLMVTDLHMPELDGFQFMDAIAKQGFRGGLIIVSGQSQAVLHSATLVAQLRRFTLLGVIPKPVSRADLSKLLSRWN
jgi:CheY-like chemotaxis protein